MSIVPARAFHQFLRLDGAADGSPDMNVDGSSAAKSFEIDTDVVGGVLIVRMTAVIVDSGVDPDDFGGINTGLTNGVSFKILDGDDGTDHDLLDGSVVKINADLAWLSGRTTTQAGAGDSDIVASWEMKETHGRPLYMQGGQRLQALVQDDLSSITKFRVMVHGQVLSPGGTGPPV